MMFQLIKNVLIQNTLNDVQSLANAFFNAIESADASPPFSAEHLLPLIGFLLTIFSALRLAKFNIDRLKYNN